MSDDKSFNQSLETLKNNDKNEIKIVCETLLKILRKIQTNPNDQTARSIQLSSDDVQYSLLPYEGAFEILFDIGFQEVIHQKERASQIVKF